MLTQIQELQIMEERVFTKSDRDIINYLQRKDQVESKVLFRYITGRLTYNKDIEDELRSMLKSCGYGLHKRRVFFTFNQTYNGKPYYSNNSIWYYSLSQHRRRGCHPCGIQKSNQWMSRCLHWQKCHYGMAGKCQLALSTMN